LPKLLNRNASRRERLRRAMRQACAINGVAGEDAWCIPTSFAAFTVLAVSAIEDSMDGQR
jgi:hypothetical protein